MGRTFISPEGGTTDWPLACSSGFSRFETVRAWKGSGQGWKDGGGVPPFSASRRLIHQPGFRPERRRPQGMGTGWNLSLPRIANVLCRKADRRTFIPPEGETTNLRSLVVPALAGFKLSSRGKVLGREWKDGGSIPPFSASRRLIHRPGFRPERRRPQGMGTGWNLSLPRIANVLCRKAERRTFIPPEGGTTNLRSLVVPALAGFKPPSHRKAQGEKTRMDDGEWRMEGRPPFSASRRLIHQPGFCPE